MKKIAVLTIATIIFSNPVIWAQTGKIISSFPAPSKYCTGLTYDGRHLWTADRKTDKIYCLDTGNGKILKTLESPGYFPTGMCWDGQFLWNADIRGRSDISENFDGMIFQIDPENGNIIKTLKSPVSSPQGLAWDGKYLWVVDERKNIVVQFSTVDGSTIHSFPSPASDPMGITYDGKYLWISDRVKNEFYMVEPRSGAVIIIAQAPGPYMRGLSYDGKNLWCVDFQTDMLYKIKIRDKVQFLKYDRKEQSVNYTHQTKVFGPGQCLSLDVHLALPQTRPNQEIIGKISFSPKPTQIDTDRWGQRTAHYHFDNLKSGTQLDLSYTANFNSWYVRYFLYPENLGSMKDIPTHISKKYLVDDEKYQLSHPRIQQTVTSVVGDEKNPYWILRKIHQYLIDHLEYIMDGYWDTAPTVIRNGHGSCSEYTFTFIALCRAAGLPARYVGATWIKKDAASMDNVFHRWVEVYLPGFGWVPTDPTHGDRKSPRDQAFPIGLCRNAALITTVSGGGSKTMGWTYNSNEAYQTEPKTNMNFEYFADWLPARDFKILKENEDTLPQCNKAQ
ncbi:transglutaminase [bacterium]|nr:transglutaminase [bacterium]